MKHFIHRNYLVTLLRYCSARMGMKRLALWHLVLAVVLGAGIHAARGATGVEFSQLSFQLDGVAYNQTDWGDASLAYTPLQGSTYFNLAINGVWQVQNVQLMPVDGGGEQTIHFAYDLGVPRGTPVSSTQYDYQITSTPLAAMPGGSLTVPVNPDSVVMNSGHLDEPLGVLGAPPGPFVGSTNAGPAALAPNFPNQDCGLNECVPAAVSNSLLYLNARGKISMPPGLCNISTMKVATGWTSWGSPTRYIPFVMTPWWETKDAYMNANRYGVTTTYKQIASLAAPDKFQAMRWLKDQLNDGQDVELGLVGHEVALTGIRTAGPADMWDLIIKQDRAQGVVGGRVTQYCTFDDQTGLLIGIPGGPRMLISAVVECPEPATLLLFGLGGLMLRKHKR